MHAEKKIQTLPGGAMLAVVILMFVGSIVMIIAAIATESFGLLFPALAIMFLALIFMGGFFVVQPNEAAVLLLFGDYKGSTRRTGFHFANPFMKKIKLSLRARNLNGERLKVNDKTGNPVVKPINPVAATCAV